MSLDGIGRIYESQPDSLPVGDGFNTAGPYDRDEESGDALPTQAAVARDNESHEMIGNYYPDEADSASDSDSTVESHNRDEEARDNLPAQTAVAHVEEPNPTRAWEHDGSSQQQSGDLDTQPTPDTDTETAEPESSPQASSSIGEVAVAASRQVDIPVADTELEELVDLSGGSYTDYISRDLVTAEPEDPSDLHDINEEDVAIVPDQTEGVADVLSSYWTTADASATETKDHPVQIEQTETAVEVGDLDEMRRMLAADVYRPEATDVQEIHENPEPLDRDEIDRAAEAIVISNTRDHYRPSTTYTPTATTTPDIQSPISTPSKPKPAWLERRVERLVQEHGDLPLFGLLVSEVRARKAEAREDVHERYKDLTQGLPGIWSGFAYKLPFEARRDEFFRRSDLMKAQDRRDKIRAKQQKQVSKIRMKEQKQADKLSRKSR